MQGRTFVIAVGVLIFAVVGSGDVASAEQPLHVETASASAELVFDDTFPPAYVSAGCRDELPRGGPTCEANIYMQQSPSGWTIGEAVIDSSQFSIDKSLTGASLTATIEGIMCDYLFSPPCVPITIGVDVQWTAVDQPINSPMGLAKQEDNDPPDCRVTNVAHSIGRKAVASGTVTIQSTEFTSVGSHSADLARASHPHDDGTYC